MTIVYRDQRYIHKGTDTPVRISFSFTGDFAASGLNTFTSLTVGIGSENYSTTDNPAKVVIVDNATLELAIGDVTQLSAGDYNLEITGFSGDYIDGYVITSAGKPVLPKVIVID